MEYLWDIYGISLEYLLLCIDFAGQEPLISRGDGPDQNLSLNTFAGLW
jgi:hypothetical protein